MSKSDAEEDAIVETIRAEIHREVGEARVKLDFNGSLREEASLCLALDKLEGPVADLAVLHARTPGNRLNPPPDIPTMLSYLSEVVDKLNAGMSQIVTLAEDITSKMGNQLLGIIKAFLNKSIMRFMPEIAAYLKLQSWSLGISAAGFASLTLTFGA